MTMPSSSSQCSSEVSLDVAESGLRSAEETPAAAPPNPRLEALEAKKAKLSTTLAELEQKRSELVQQTKLPSGLDMPADWSEQRKSDEAVNSANAVIKEHITLLHKYNEIKDIAQGLMGLIADQRGERLGAVMQSFDMGEKD